MVWLFRIIAIVAAAIFVNSAVAQTGPGMGGPGSGWKGWAWNSDTVPGWQLMTPDERTEHQNKMRSMKTYADCETYHKEHWSVMEQRAKEKGVAVATPRRDPCEVMKARGIVK
jgi:hypothetical protein